MNKEIESPQYGKKYGLCKIGIERKKGINKNGIITVGKLRGWERERKVLQEKETEKLECFVLGESLGSRKQHMVRMMGAKGYNKRIEKEKSIIWQ